MIQSNNWNTAACIRPASGHQAERAEPVPGRLQERHYDNEAAAVGNGQAAMELMGQWAPGVEMADSTSKRVSALSSAGSRSRPSPAARALRPTASAAATASRSARTRRPRRSTSSSSSAASRTHRSTARIRRPASRPSSAPRARSRTRTCRPSSRAEQGQLHPALPRPGDLPGHGDGDQRRDNRPVPGTVDAPEGLPGDHGRGGGAVAVDSAKHRTARMAAIAGRPRRPARFLEVAGAPTRERRGRR